MTARFTACAATLAAAVVMTTGCGGTPVQATAGADPTPRTLTIYTARDKDAVALVVGRFVRKIPQYEGTVNVITMSAQDALTRLRAEKGNPQAGFLWGGTQQGLEQAAREGLLAPSSPAAAARLDPSQKDPQGRWHAGRGERCRSSSSSPCWSSPAASRRAATAFGSASREFLRSVAPRSVERVEAFTRARDDDPVVRRNATFECD